MKSHNISIDILKFFAALLITNSHMELLYGKYSMLATGGSIGDVLFFFASGFTLFLGRMGRFDNWYKRRINRIYPTIFAWATLSSFVLGYQNDMKYTVIHGGGWFVTCIMMYYIILWIIRRIAENKLEWAFAVASAVVLVSYFFFNRPQGWNMYGATYYKWMHYFLFMLLGAIIGKMPKQRLNFSFSHDLAKLLLCVVAFYAVFIASLRIQYVAQFQIVSLLPLLGVTFYSYKVCNSRQLKRCYDNRYIGWCMKFIGGLCLEIYIVQYSLFTDAMNRIFPLNILIMFLIIFAAAYLLRCVSRIFAQTFKDGEYDWREVFKVV
ncbi:acyltransferase family protein [Phocaeicola sp.]|uniref:acyltransferase family protein n=1 Tax=Phocaeicola sp. TaxID=2773926 RepID=UPI003A8F39D1